MRTAGAKWPRACGAWRTNSGQAALLVAKAGPTGCLREGRAVACPCRGRPPIETLLAAADNHAEAVQRARPKRRCVGCQRDLGATLAAADWPRRLTTRWPPRGPDGEPVSRQLPPTQRIHGYIMEVATSRVASMHARTQAHLYCTWVPIVKETDACVSAGRWATAARYRRRNPTARRAPHAPAPAKFLGLSPLPPDRRGIPSVTHRAHTTVVAPAAAAARPRRPRPPTGTPIPSRQWGRGAAPQRWAGRARHSRRLSILPPANAEAGGVRVDGGRHRRVAPRPHRRRHPPRPRRASHHRHARRRRRRRYPARPGHARARATPPVRGWLGLGRPTAGRPGDRAAALADHHAPHLCWQSHRAENDGGDPCARQRPPRAVATATSRHDPPPSVGGGLPGRTVPPPPLLVALDVGVCEQRNQQTSPPVTDKKKREKQREKKKKKKGQGRGHSPPARPR